MANLYKKPVVKTDATTGKKIKRKSGKWWGRYRDEHGVEKRVPLTTDKGAAQAMLNECVRKAERRKAGIEDPFDDHRKRPLLEHLAAFQKHLSNKRTTLGHVNTTTQRVDAII